MIFWNWGYRFEHFVFESQFVPLPATTTVGRDLDSKFRPKNSRNTMSNSWPLYCKVRNLTTTPEKFLPAAFSEVTRIPIVLRPGPILLPRAKFLGVYWKDISVVGTSSVFQIFKWLPLKDMVDWKQTFWGYTLDRGGASLFKWGSGFNAVQLTPLSIRPQCDKAEILHMI